jgi:hypothetical protein
MRRISKKTEHVQVQLDLLDDCFRSPMPARSPYWTPHTPFLTSHAIAVAPDDTGQPPPPPLEPAIPNVRTPLLNFITKPRPLSPKSLRQTPERNPHDPTTRRSPDHPRQISAWLDRVSDSANSWRAWVKTCSRQFPDWKQSVLGRRNPGSGPSGACTRNCWRQRTSWASRKRNCRRRWRNWA